MIVFLSFPGLGAECGGWEGWEEGKDTETAVFLFFLHPLSALPSVLVFLLPSGQKQHFLKKVSEPWATCSSLLSGKDTVVKWKTTHG